MQQLSISHGILHLDALMEIAQGLALRYKHGT